MTQTFNLCASLNDVLQMLSRVNMVGSLWCSPKATRHDGLVPNLLSGSDLYDTLYLRESPC